MRRLFTFSAVLASALLSLPVAPAVFGATAKILVNVDGAGVALQGYDPVSFFDGKPVAGKPDLTAAHEGATYRFASEGNRDRFQKTPARFAPAYGGFCAMGVAFGGLYAVEISTGQILDGRLVLNKNADIKKMFDSGREENSRKADGRWPEIVEKKGK